MVVCLFQLLLQIHTSSKEHEICKKPRQGRASLPCGEFTYPQDKQRVGEVALCAVCPAGVTYPHTPTPSPKVCFLSIHTVPLQAWRTDRRKGQGRTGRKESSACLVGKS